MLGSPKPVCHYRCPSGDTVWVESHRRLNKEPVKKKILEVATLNVGSMNGRGMEVPI